MTTDLQMRGMDAAYVAVAHHRRIPLITWDREQTDRAGQLIAVYTPDRDV